MFNVDHLTAEEVEHYAVLGEVEGITAKAALQLSGDWQSALVENAESSNFISQDKMAEIEEGIKLVAKDTVDCWISTRIQNRSASLACYGNISFELLKILDDVLLDMLK